MKRPGTDLHVVGLQQGTTLASPVTLQCKNQVLECFGLVRHGSDSTGSRLVWEQARRGSITCARAKFPTRSCAEDCAADRTIAEHRLSREPRPVRLAAFRRFARSGRCCVVIDRTPSSCRRISCRPCVRPAAGRFYRLCRPWTCGATCGLGVAMSAFSRPASDAPGCRFAGAGALNPPCPVSPVRGNGVEYLSSENPACPTRQQIGTRKWQLTVARHSRRARAMRGPSSTRTSGMTKWRLLEPQAS